MKWYNVIISMLMGYLATITRLLTQNFNTIENYKEARLSTRELYRKIFFSGTTFIATIISAVLIALVFIMLDYIINQSKKSKKE